MERDPRYFYTDAELEQIRKELVEGNRRAQEAVKGRYAVNPRIAAANLK